MKSVAPSAVRDVLLLSFAAGSADATGYFGLGRVFTCNMTGNVVLLGVDLGQGHFLDATRSLFVLLFFMLGVALGGVLGKGVAERDWPGLAKRLISLEKIVLVLFGGGWILVANKGLLTDHLLLAMLASAMGLQSAALNRLNAPGVGTTAITGTITALMNGLVAVAVDRTEQPSISRIKFQSGVVLLYCVGAACSGFLLASSITWLAGCLPVIAVLLVWPRSHRRS